MAHVCSCEYCYTVRLAHVDFVLLAVTPLLDCTDPESACSADMLAAAHDAVILLTQILPASCRICKVQSTMMHTACEARHKVQLQTM